ncbi:TetR/AcrR family transcriptional regulator [Ferrovibrio sp.]|uniref:TetR/AcrR family transcriptional regulator n=1 Tax=Ferrovibrio sp. TaxID=1917215 RepID=UPI00311D78DE
MSRPKAADYDSKREMILKRAAELFAEQGYERASLSALAEALGISKALVYHYYNSKEALLFDVIDRHINNLLTAVEEADNPALPPVKRLERLTLALLMRYKDADSAHNVQLNDLDILPEEMQRTIRADQRKLVRYFSTVIALVNPDLDKPSLTAATMSLFGMLNWHYTWFHDNGSMTREGYAKFATDLFLKGIGVKRAKPASVRKSA